MRGRASASLPQWRRLAVVLALAWGSSTLAVALEQPALEKMTNGKVVEIHKLGLGDEVILEKIRSSTCAFDVGIAKMKSKAVLNNPHAMLQILDSKPTFYFYFETTGSGLGGSGFGYFSVATSANEFVLVRTEVKKATRELVVGQFNAFGAQGGVQDKSMVPFDFERVSPGTYKVVPRTDLKGGEYCFFYGGSTPIASYGFVGPMGGGKVFDFGVASK